MGLQIGRLAVRRSIYIKASPERVWQEFSSFESIAAWLGNGQTLHVFEPVQGGRADLSVEIGGERRHFGGRVLVCDPGRELTYESNWQPPHQWPVPTFITIRLTALYDGTHVELFHHGFERLGAEAADNLEGYESGWTLRHLTALRGLAEA